MNLLFNDIVSIRINGKTYSTIEITDLETGQKIIDHCYYVGKLNNKYKVALSPLMFTSDESIPPHSGYRIIVDVDECDIVLLKRPKYNREGRSKNEDED